ncbi:MAG: c-type cytochrome [Chloroflexi bacterium]|nr:c-type cytochrome [Chloroflexota bacterium]
MKTGLLRGVVMLVLLGLGFTLTACGLGWQSLPPQPGSVSETPLGDSPSVANGERIYFTGTSGRGGQIRYQGGPAFGGMMMGSYLTCAACHGLAAQGGRHIMHMVVMDAPDIRITALAGEVGEHGGDHSEYDLETFRKAVVDGQHANGELLSQDMPRWQMSDTDLADLFAFLQSLP